MFAPWSSHVEANASGRAVYVVGSSGSAGLVLIEHLNGCCNAGRVSFESEAQGLSGPLDGDVLSSAGTK